MKDYQPFFKQLSKGIDSGDIDEKFPVENNKISRDRLYD